MLPWVCDLSKKPELESKFPYYRNIAADYISDVTYSSRKKDDGTGTMAFLTFRLFIPQTSPELSNDHKFQIAYSEPYTYSRLLILLTELQTSGLA